MEKNELMWKKIEYPGVKKNMYLISENGDVMNIISGKLLKPRADKDGYLKIRLAGLNKAKNAFILRRFHPSAWYKLFGTGHLPPDLKAVKSSAFRRKAPLPHQVRCQHPPG